MTTIPTISTAFDPETEQHYLTVSSHGWTEPAGPRILRALPWPDIQWRHDTEDGARKDAAKLSAYLQGLGKAPSRSKVRHAGE